MILGDCLQWLLGLEEVGLTQFLLSSEGIMNPKWEVLLAYLVKE